MKRRALACLYPALYIVALYIVESPASAQDKSIHVGPNVLVSVAHQKYSMGEVLLAADLEDPNHLLGCGIVYAESENRRWTVVYLSTDGGRSWQSTLETKRFEDSADPACGLGRNGFAFHATLGLNASNKTEFNYFLGSYRSLDGGKTWSQQNVIPLNFEGLDRESVTIDRTRKNSDDRVYITGECAVPSLEGPSKNGFAVWRSRDLGMTFEGPVKRASAPNHYLLGVGNSVVLSDGTLVSLFGDVKNSDGHFVPPANAEESNALLEVVTTKSDGASISQATKIDDFFMDTRPGNKSFGMPTLAVDPSGGPFRDRLYAAWADERDGRSEIRLAYSADRGKRWSKSAVIDDIPGPIDEKKGPDNFLPTVAVNKKGIVAVTWYDRRENPDGLGWYLRFRASLDGGETWLPSVRISQAANTFSKRLFTVSAVQHGDVGRRFDAPGTEDSKSDIVRNDTGQAPENSGDQRTPTHVTVALQGRQFFAGDYAGLTADAGGTFHAFWIDDRTGLAQIWTAAIGVEGEGVRNGTAELAEFRDVSGSVDLKIMSTSYDRTSNTVTLGVELKNSSVIPVEGPIKLRLVGLTSRLGNPLPVNADNQFTGLGAVWDFSSWLRNNALRPGEASSMRQLVFRVDHPRELLDGKSVHVGLLDFDIRVLARRAAQ